MSLLLQCFPVPVCASFHSRNRLRSHLSIWRPRPLFLPHGWPSFPFYLLHHIHHIRHLCMLSSATISHSFSLTFHKNVILKKWMRSVTYVVKRYPLSDEIIKVSRSTALIETSTRVFRKLDLIEAVGKSRKLLLLSISIFNF